MPTESRLTALLITLMTVQSSLGLLLPGQYRDADWIRATWYGNDWVTLLGAVPLLWFGGRRAAHGSLRGLLLVLGMAAYAIYNYAFYLFGAALNAFLPIYVASTLAALALLGVLLARLDVRQVAGSFRPDTPVRLIGGYLVFVAAALTLVWLGMWGAYVFTGRPTPVEPEAFKVVAALDLTLMVPAVGGGGVLLWTRRPWGYVIATTAAIQSALYLLVLSVNASVAIARGLAAAPGELPVWGPLAATTLLTAAVLVGCASGRDAPCRSRVSRS